MKRVLMLLGTGITAFAISAGSALYFQGGMQTPEQASADAAQKGPLTEAERGPQQEPAGAASEPAAGTADVDPFAPTLSAATPAPIMAEEIVRLAEKLRARLADVKRREEELEIRETRLQILYDDLRAEREAIAALRQQVNKQLELLKQQVAQLQQEQQRLAQRQQQLKEQTIMLSDSEAANIRKMAEMFNTMSADSAALMLQAMANSGNITTAVQVLARMNPRNAGKVLAEMPDKALAAQLTERIKGLIPVQSGMAQQSSP